MKLDFKDVLSEVAKLLKTTVLPAQSNPAMTKQQLACTIAILIRFIHSIVAENDNFTLVQSRYTHELQLLRFPSHGGCYWYHHRHPLSSVWQIQSGKYFTMFLMTLETIWGLVYGSLKLLRLVLGHAHLKYVKAYGWERSVLFQFRYRNN